MNHLSRLAEGWDMKDNASITFKRSVYYIEKLREFLRETRKDEDDPEFKEWADGIISSAIVVLEQLT